MPKPCGTCGNVVSTQPEVEIVVHEQVLNSIKIENLTIKPGGVVVAEVKEPTVKISVNDSQ